MPIADILTLLIAERGKLNRAIEALATEPRRRGRPPKTAMAGAARALKRKRKGMSRGARLAQSKRMRAFWAERRKAQGSKLSGAAQAKPQRRPRMSAAARKAASERMKRYWAARPKTQKAGAAK